MTTSLRLFPSALPRVLSELPRPYVSAVSKKLMPLSIYRTVHCGSQLWFINSPPAVSSHGTASHTQAGYSKVWVLKYYIFHLSVSIKYLSWTGRLLLPVTESPSLQHLLQLFPTYLLHFEEKLLFQFLDHSQPFCQSFIFLIHSRADFYQEIA